MLESDGFQVVSFAKERERVLNELATKPIDLMAVASDNRDFHFQVTKVQTPHLILKLKPTSSRVLKVGEVLEIVFALSDGQFVLKTPVLKVVDFEVSVEFGPQLFRLQRRNNFRVPIARDSRMLFRLLKLQSKATRCDLKVDDLSAGGVRVFWPNETLGEVEKYHQVSGTVSLTTGENIEVTGEIKNVFSDGKATRVGIEFTHLSSRDEQALLLYCIKVGRVTKT
jgi:c-di-GMP-binding flagellar brake protein YcgR